MVTRPIVIYPSRSSRWPILVSKIKQLTREFKGYSHEQVKSIKAQTMIMMGDREGIRPEHAVEMYRAIRGSQLAIIPAGDHFLMFLNPQKVLAILKPFL